MNKIKALKLFAIILIVVLTAVLGFGCSSSNETVDPTDDPTEVSAVTASPDGEVTASPTKEASAGTDDPSDPSDPSATQQTGAETGDPEDTDTPEGSAKPLETFDGTVPTSTPSPMGTLNPNLPVFTHAPTAAPTSAAATPLPNNEFEAHYGGASADCSGLAVGDSFYWTLDLLNEGSRLWSAQWLIDYPESLLEITAYSVTWSEGITAITNASWDDETDWSDKPAFVCNPTYMGNTGGHPKGEAGNMYANVGMYLTSFHHYGVQMSGSMIRLKFTIKAMPSSSQLKHDEGGDYLEIPILVCESTAFIDAPADSAVQPYTCTPHGTVTCEPGKLYFKH